MDEQPTLLEQVKAEREATEKVLADVRIEREQFEKIRSEKILSGRTDAGKVPEVKPEIDARTYAKAALRGQILK